LLLAKGPSEGHFAAKNGAYFSRGKILKNQVPTIC
jgi:hypothetical protein